MLPPVIWKPTNKFGYPRGATGRLGQPVRAFVNHRIVGTLASADYVFRSDNSRLASAHFAVGYSGLRTDPNRRLEIHQYVDLADAAWTNGDVREPTAKVVLANPGVNPNLYTVTIEHEDGGSADGGVVKPEVWAASIELQRLLTSGDAAAIRRAGIRVRSDATVAQMAKVPKTADGFIDHHQISGPNKPYCWRRWLDDPGFVEGAPSRRDRLLTALQEDDVNRYLVGMELIVNRNARLKAGSTARRSPEFNPRDYDANKIFTLGSASWGPAIGWVQGTNLTLADGTIFDKRTRWLVTYNADHGLVFWHERDLERLAEVEQGEDCTPLRQALTAAQAPLDQAIAAATTALDRAKAARAAIEQ